jgi:signal transduction histidine kinase
MAVSGIVLVIGILIGFWLARHISVPVLELRDAALKVGEGDRTQQVKKRTHDEIGELSDAFNKMVKDLVKAEEKVKSAQRQLVQAEKMASLGQLTAGIAHEIQNPLNFVNNFSDISSQFINDYNSTTDEKEKTELLNAINENLKKIHHHGKRADNIIKSMLQHSRSGRSEKELTDINQICNESLNLSFQSMRSKDITFNCALEKKLAPDLPKLLLIQQDIMRVLINLFNNAFYSIHERSKKENTGGETTYQPQVSLSTELSGFSKIIITVRDNGMGIPKEFRERIFQPFFSTKPSGEGTGLGLSLSYDIITKRHEGEICVNSVEGEGTEFIITLSNNSLFANIL